MNGAEFRLLALGERENPEGETLGALAFITLSDPQKNGNALDIDLLRNLLAQLESWASLPIRALILRSSSELAFSVGMNFTAFQSAKNGASTEAAQLYRRLLAALDSFRPRSFVCWKPRPVRVESAWLWLPISCWRQRKPV